MRTPSISRGKLMAFSVKMQFTSNRHATMIHLECKNGRPGFSFERSEREREKERGNREKKMIPICVTAARRKSDRAYKCERRSIGHKPNYRSIRQSSVSFVYRKKKQKKKSKKYKSRDTWTQIAYIRGQLIHGTNVTLLRGVARNSAQFPLVHRGWLVSRSRNNPELTVFAVARADNNVAVAVARTRRDPNEWTYLYVDSTWIYVRGLVIE